MMHEYVGYHIEGAPATDIRVQYQKAVLDGVESWLDILKTDLTIPGGMGGKEAAAQLLAIDPQAKLIVASGYSDDPVMANFQDHGFKAAMSKPFILDTLDDAINICLT